MPKAVSSDVAAFTKDWKRLQAQKWRMRGGVEARMITNVAMRAGEQYVQQSRDAIFARPMDKDENKNRLALVFNLIKKQTNRKIGHLYRIHNTFNATPNSNDPVALDTSDVVKRAIRGLNSKLRENLQHWRRLRWMVECGVVIEHTPWVEDAIEDIIPAYDEATGQLLWRDNQNPDPQATLPQSMVERMVQAGATPERFTIIEHTILTGEVGSHIVSPFNFFIDASVLTIEDLGPGQGCYIGEIKSLDFVESNFGSEAAAACQNTGNDLGIVRSRLLDRGGSTVANINMRDLLPAITGSKGPDDPPMTILLTRYEPACPKWPHGRRSIFNPDGVMLDDAPTDYGEIPCTDFHYEAPTTSFWTGDYVTDLVPGQKFLNKRMSQLGEAANAQLYELLLLGPDLTATDVPTDMHGHVEDGLGDDGSPRVVPMQHAQLPSFFLQSIELVIQLMQQIGAVDILDHKQMPGQLRGPMALPLFQEMVDSEDAPLYLHCGEQLARMHQQRMNRIKQYYPPMRTLHYTGKGKRDEVLVFHTDKVLRSGITYTITLDPGSAFPEFSALKEARIMERLASPLAGLYADRRTGKIDYSKIAYELRFTDQDDTDRQSQYRTLAQHLIGRLWEGQPLSTSMPEVPYAFWDHLTILDELEASMATTEFLEASAVVKTEFVTLYEKCRAFLAAVQDAQAQAAQQQMMNSTLAQVSQQTAAMVAARTVDTAQQQIDAQRQAATVNPPTDQIQQAMGNAMGGNRPAPGVH